MAEMVVVDSAADVAAVPPIKAAPSTKAVPPIKAVPPTKAVAPTKAVPPIKAMIPPTKAVPPAWGTTAPARVSAAGVWLQLPVPFCLCAEVRTLRRQS